MAAPGGESSACPAATQAQTDATRTNERPRQNRTRVLAKRRLVWLECTRRVVPMTLFRSSGEVPFPSMWRGYIEKTPPSRKAKGGAYVFRSSLDTTLNAPCRLVSELVPWHWLEAAPSGALAWADGRSSAVDPALNRALSHPKQLYSPHNPRIPTRRLGLQQPKSAKGRS